MALDSSGAKGAEWVTCLGMPIPSSRNEVRLCRFDADNLHEFRHLVLPTIAFFEEHSFVVLSRSSGGPERLVTTMVLDNLQPLAYAISSVMFAIGTFSFFARFYCRAFLKNIFGWDDVLSIFLLVCFTNQPLSRKVAKQTRSLQR